MTLIQPQHTSFLSRLLVAAMAAVVTVGVVLLIVSYNEVVNLRYGISKMQEDLKSLQRTNAALQDEVFTKLTTAHLEEFAQGRNLIQERQPRYLQVEQSPDQWALVSQ